MEVSSGSVSSGTLSSSAPRGLYIIFDVAWLNRPIIVGCSRSGCAGCWVLARGWWRRGSGELRQYNPGAA